MAIQSGSDTARTRAIATSAAQNRHRRKQHRSSLAREYRRRSDPLPGKRRSSKQHTPKARCACLNISLCCCRAAAHSAPTRPVFTRACTKPVATGNLEYFDNTRMRLDARHILASGALPPAFPAIEIDGQFYWDGGLVSNTPLSHVLTAESRSDTLVFQVDLWNARGELPQTLLDVAQRQKEIQYSSRTRLITYVQRVGQHYRRLLRELLEEIPDAVRASNPWCQHAAELACDSRTSMIHLIYRERSRFGHFKDYQFGRVAMREHWQAGLADIGRALAHPEWLQLPTGETTFATHDATAP